MVMVQSAPSALQHMKLPGGHAPGKHTDLKLSSAILRKPQCTCTCAEGIHDSYRAIRLTYLLPNLYGLSSLLLFRGTGNADFYVNSPRL